MSAKFSTQELIALSTMTLDELISAVRNAGVVRMGVNNHLILAEFGLRFDLPTDAVAVAIVRPINPRHLEKGYNVWHWAKYSSEKIDVFRSMPERKWNSSMHSNSFTTTSEDEPLIFGKLCNLYTKSVIITDDSFRIEEGSGSQEWNNPIAHELSDAPIPVNLTAVLSSYLQLRPGDKPRGISLHGEYDGQYRTLFDREFSNLEQLDGLNFHTRHKKLIFRIPQMDGSLRYTVYSTIDDLTLEVLFPESRKLDLNLSQFKESQQRLGIPLIEAEPVHNEPLRSAMRRPFNSNKTP